MESQSTGLFGGLLRSFMVSLLQQGPVPKHIGFIMDGNRRYAKQHNEETQAGHSEGFNTLSRILDFSYRLGIKEVTVYAFSIENFNRPAAEVASLMAIAKTRLKQICENGELVQKYGIKVNILGDVSLLPADVRKVCEQVEEISKNNSSVTLNICMPYTARDDITHSIKRIAGSKEYGTNGRRVSTETIKENLYTGPSQPLDILVRTSGTDRFSDFLLWEIQETKNTYVEFTTSLWPEYSLWQYFKTLLRWSTHLDF